MSQCWYSSTVLVSDRMQTHTLDAAVCVTLRHLPRALQATPLPLPCPQIEASLKELNEEGLAARAEAATSARDKAKEELEAAQHSVEAAARELAGMHLRQQLQPCCSLQLHLVLALVTAQLDTAGVAAADSARPMQAVCMQRITVLRH
jgi:hypothetical protein